MLRHEWFGERRREVERLFHGPEANQVEKLFRHENSSEERRHQRAGKRGEAECDIERASGV